MEHRPMRSGEIKLKLLEMLARLRAGQRDGRRRRRRQADDDFGGLVKTTFLLFSR